MNTGDWERVQTLFAAALERPPEQRAAYVAAAAPDPDVKREVLSLLAAHEPQGRFDDVADQLRDLGPAEASQLRAALADRYTIRRELGRGGMAVVYLAADLRHDRLVALKVLRPEIAMALGTERFLQEIRTTAQLVHPHVVSLLDSGDAQGRLFYVMSYVEGESLRDRLDRERQLPLADALQIALEVADALGYAHRHGVVHRDIKPENILLQSGHAVVADFGIAKAIDEAGRERLTATGVAVGTPLYMSPEQAAGSRNLDGRSDLYSLGCVLYEMLAGHPPFQGSSAHEVVARHQSDPVPPLRTGRTTIPKAVAGAVERVLAKTPADRFPTAAEFTAALRSPDAPAASRRRRSRRPAVLATGLLAVAALAAVGWYALRGGRGATFAARRVVVAPFEDQTGDARMAQLGDLAADWITRRLSQTLPSVEVMPATLVREAWQGTATATANHVRVLAESLAAAVVVSGRYSREGATLRFEGEIIDARGGRLIAGIEPVVGPADSVNALVSRLAERTTAAAAAHLEPGVTQSTATEENPPSLEVFREYQQGLEMFSRGAWEEAIAHFRHAMAMDSTYLSPVPWAATAYNNLGRFGASDTLLERARSRIGRLTPSERVNVEWLSAIVRGDQEGQMRWAEEGFRLAPGTWAYPLGLSAVVTNRPQRALEVLPQWERGTLFARNWIGYRQQLGNAYHLLGQYRAELAVARQWRAESPQQLAALALELRALIGLGRLAEADALVQQSASLPAQGQGPTGTTPALIPLVAAQELRTHGFPDAATATINRAIEQIDHGALADADTYVRGRALYLAGRWAEARSVFDSLHRGAPRNVDYLGFLGASYARLADRPRATAVDSALALMRQPYIRGRHTLWRAQIAALLGERDRAVRLLQQSVAEGALRAIDLHRETNLESLRDYPPFEAFMRPRE